jgi:membrane peptidoglycan carboxypeptidase
MLHTRRIRYARNARRNRSRSSPAAGFALGCSVLISLGLTLATFVVAWGYIYLVQNLPSPEHIPLMLDPPNGLLLEPTRIYDRSGERVLLTLENPAINERRVLTLDPTQPDLLPAPLISATLAIADVNFWQHPGFTLQSLQPDRHPTLAQKLVYDLLLREEPPSLRRALRERLLAAQITARYGRQRVLLWFLNNVDYGRLVFGAEAAARVYFGKGASQLNLAEAAVLAATMQAPALNPHDAPQSAIERAHEIIQKMLAEGWITPQQAEQALKTELTFQPRVAPTPVPAQAFIRLALEQLGGEFSLARLERGGLRLITTLDYDLQAQALCVVQTQLARLRNQPDPYPLSDNGPCPAAGLLPTLPSNIAQPQGEPAANLILLDHKTGQILAMVGDTTPGLDPTQLPGHPPGTLLTPFIYLTGFTRGLGPASLVWDIPSQSSSLKNPDGQYHGPLRLRLAMANDYLVPAENLLAQAGTENFWQILKQFGLITGETPAAQNADAILQESSMTLLDLTRAYGAIANQGTLVGIGTSATPNTSSHSLAAVSWLRLEDSTGKVWRDTQLPQVRPVVSPQLAYLLTHILSDEPARWPSLGHPNPLEVGRPLAAKLGLTASQQETWAIGATPTLTIGVWIGLRNAPPSAKLSPLAAAGVLHALVQYASRDTPSQDWPEPPGISHLTVCDPSGMLPTPECPLTVNEVFLAGNEPTHPDTLYRRLQVNRESGLLATVFTPPDLIEERTYLILPPEAEEWARQAGLPIPPKTYDVLPADLASSPEVQITFPEMFAYVRGKVSIQGAASGRGFQRYRLQIGQGLNPRQWLQIGQDSTQPVTQGVLGIWDTQGLSGLYALQLLVIYEDRRIESDIIQVTVDNQPPALKIVSPAEGQQFSTTEKTILLQAQASDDLSLSRLEFYVNNRWIATLNQPPFLAYWQSQPGKHILRLRAIDAAGNISSAEISFSVR